MDAVAWDPHNIYAEDAVAKSRRHCYDGALESWNEAIRLRSTPCARWNRGQVRLQLGDYGAFADDFTAREEVFLGSLTQRGRAIANRLPRWRGEDITGKRLVILHECGYGDSIMLLRYVPQLKATGIEVALDMPLPLQSMAQQLAPLGTDGDLCCPIYDLLAHLKPTPQTVPGAPYLTVDEELREQWGKLAARCESGRRIGITWTCGYQHDCDGNRSLPLDLFLRLLDVPPGNVFSLQQQGRGDAQLLGVHAFQFADFADVAALASLMDTVISIDTAAIHAVGATGHRNAAVLLPYLASWRWAGGNVWYPQVKRCRQSAPDDWASAFAAR